MPRTYISLGKIASAVGLPAQTIHTVHRPVHWGVPGDWKLDGALTLYSSTSLPALAVSFEEAGEHAAARRLREEFIDQAERDLLWFQRGAMA